MDVYFNKNNSVKIQQEFFFSHLSSTTLIGCFMLEFSQPSHAHKFHANAKLSTCKDKGRTSVYNVEDACFNCSY